MVCLRAGAVEGVTVVRLKELRFIAIRAIKRVLRSHAFNGLLQLMNRKMFG